MIDTLPDSETVLAQFNRLVAELLRGSPKRNSFRRWEIELLLDFETCDFGAVNKREILKRYQKAVQRHMEKGARLPFKLSEYLDSLRSRRAAASKPDPPSNVGYPEESTGIPSDCEGNYGLR
jgi:hypothetical protein